MVSKKTLVFIAALIWLGAGFNVFRLGAVECIGRMDWLLILSAVLIFVPFFIMFQQMAAKNTCRIVELKGQKHFLLNFFTIKSYVIITLMITLGVVLRNIEAVPRFFIGFFYTGLGAALFVAGIKYLLNFIRFEILKEQAMQ